MYIDIAIRKKNLLNLLQKQKERSELQRKTNGAGNKFQT